MAYRLSLIAYRSDLCIEPLAAARTPPSPRSGGRSGSGRLKNDDDRRMRQSLFVAAGGAG
jgi:hypothetical protein